MLADSPRFALPRLTVTNEMILFNQMVNQNSARSKKVSPRRRTASGKGGRPRIGRASKPRHARIDAERDGRLDRTFAALADPTRRAILAKLAEDEGVSVGELAEPFDMSWPAVSKHLRVLEKAGLLKQQRDGRVRRCHLDAKALQEANEWVEHYRAFWTQQLDALADYLEGDA